MTLRRLPAVMSIALLPFVAGLTQVARGAIVANVVAEEMQVSFFAQGNADLLCRDVLARGGMFATCQGFLLLDREKKTVTMQVYVTVFLSRSLAEQDLLEMMNEGAVGATVLNPPESFSMKEFRRLKYHRQINLQEGGL